jgi:hypothetical protein
MRSSICAEAWQQIKARYATGTGLREIARKTELNVIVSAWRTLAKRSLVT